MYEIRQVIARLRLGGGDREIARTQRIGRKTVANIRRMAAEHGWLDAASAKPDDAQLAGALKSPRPRAQNVSTVEPFRDDVLAWHAQGVQVTTIRPSAGAQARV